jgi:predicted nucleotidyltransferase
MLKKGRYRAYRNLPIGWVTQAVHSTDRSERILRLTIEAIVVLVLFAIVSAITGEHWSALKTFAVVFVITHTVMWLLFGNFWVYLLDSFDAVRNPGLSEVIRFIDTANSLYKKYPAVDAIFIYGSACRSMFHGKSDLDLRIVRKKGLATGFVAICLGLALKAYSLFVRMPVDLQIVDSYEFLKKQMHRDERPIVVFLSDGQTDLPVLGIDFDDVRRKPEIILRTDAAT